MKAVIWEKALWDAENTIAIKIQLFRKVIPRSYFLVLLRDYAAINM
jgi:hypothetical protein